VRIAIIGAGGVGGYFGGLLARAGHPVHVLARGANLAALRDRGIVVRTTDAEWVAPVVVDDDADALARDFAPADLAIVAVKSYSLDEVAPAARRFAERGADILPLLNGVDAAERLARLGVPDERILGGLAYVSAARVAPGVFERFTPYARVQLGERTGGVSPRASRVAAALADAGADAQAVADIALALWRKWIFLSSVSAVCGLARSPIGPLRETAGGSRLIERAVREACAVARARGVAVASDEETRTLEYVGSIPATVRPSLLLDLLAGSRTEVDVLSGAVARHAAELSLECPIHETAAAIFGLSALNRS
jgi:2-dehydropantoate 2-reductase